MSFPGENVEDCTRKMTFICQRLDAARVLKFAFQYPDHFTDVAGPHKVSDLMCDLLAYLRYPRGVVTRL